MDALQKNILWSQFGAAIEMLENAVRACPNDLWNDRSQHMLFWHTAFHTLFWLDLYLTGTTEGFAPPSPFTMSELGHSGTAPERVYSQTELLDYVEHGRSKCRETIGTLTDERVRAVCRFDWWYGEMPFGELLLYTLRHVQEHGAQLSFMLGQAHKLPNDWDDWVGRAKAEAIV